MVKDPVCGMAVDEKKTKITASLGGKTYYFCNETCLKSFTNDPKRYAK